MASEHPSTLEMSQRSSSASTTEAFTLASSRDSGDSSYSRTPMAEQQKDPSERSTLPREVQEELMEASDKVKTFILTTEAYRQHFERMRKQSTSELASTYSILLEQHDSLLKDKDVEDANTQDLTKKLEKARAEENTFRRRVQGLEKQVSFLETENMEIKNEVEDLTEVGDNLRRQLASARKLQHERPRFSGRSCSKHEETPEHRKQVQYLRRITSLETKVMQKDEEMELTRVIMLDAQARQDQLTEDLFEGLYIGGDHVLDTDTTFEDAPAASQHQAWPISSPPKRTHQHYPNQSCCNDEDLVSSQMSSMWRSQHLDKGDANSVEQSNSSRPNPQNEFIPADHNTEFNGLARAGSDRLSESPVSPKTLLPRNGTQKVPSLTSWEDIAKNAVEPKRYLTQSRPLAVPGGLTKSRSLGSLMDGSLTGSPKEQSIRDKSSDHGQLRRSASGQRVILPTVSSTIRARSLSSSASTGVNDRLVAQIQVLVSGSKNSSIVKGDSSAASSSETYEQPTCSIACTNDADSAGVKVNIEGTIPNINRSTGTATPAKSKMDMLDNYRLVSTAESWSSASSQANRLQSSQQDQVSCADDDHNDILGTESSRKGSADSPNNAWKQSPSSSTKYSTQSSRPDGATSTVRVEHTTKPEQGWSRYGHYWYEVLLHWLQTFSTLEYDTPHKDSIESDMLSPAAVLVQLRLLAMQVLALMGICCSHVQQQLSILLIPKFGSIRTLLKGHKYMGIRLMTLIWCIAMMWLLVATHSLKEQWDNGNSVRARMEVPLWRSEYWIFSPAASLGPLFIHILDQHAEPISNFV